MKQCKILKYSSLLNFCLPETLQIRTSNTVNPQVGLQSLSNQTGVTYNKIYYLGSREELQIIQRRSYIKKHNVPHFQITMEEKNIICVEMKKYQFSGMQILFQLTKKPEIFKKQMIELFESFNLLKNIYGDFQITNAKIKADSSHKIVIWPSQDYQKCFPERKIYHSSYNYRFQTRKSTVRNYLQKIRNAFVKQIEQKSLIIDYKQVEKLLNEISEILVSKCSTSINKIPNAQGKCDQSVVQKQKSKFKRNQFKKLIKSDFFKQQLFKTSYKKPISTYSKYQSKFKRFSTAEYPFLPYSHKIIIQSKIKARRSQNYDNKQKYISVFNSQTCLGQRIPLFIKEKQKAKKKQRLSNYVPFLIFSDQKCSNKKQSQKLNQKHLQRSTKQTSLQKDLFLVKKGSINNGFKEPYSLKSVQSCTQVIQNSEHSNKNTQSTNLTMNECKSQKNLFLSNLSSTEQKQLKQDFQKLFLSRRLNIQEDYEKSQNQQLRHQFTLLMG